MESGFKCGSGEPDSSFCVMMDILYHVPHLCGGFFAIFNELNSKIIRRYSINSNSHVKVIMQNHHAFDGLIYYTNGVGENSLHFFHLYCTESVIDQQFIEKIYGQTNLTYNIDGNIITLDVSEWSTIVFIASSSINIYPEIIISS